MIIPPHNIILVGDVASGETEDHQISINMSVGIILDDILEDQVVNGTTGVAYTDVKFGIDYTAAENFKTVEDGRDLSYPKLTKIACSEEGADTFTDCVNEGDGSIFYVSEFDIEGLPKFYDIACSFSAAPNSSLGKLEIPISEKYSTTTGVVTDMLNFDLIYGYNIVENHEAIRELSNTSSQFSQLVVSPEDMFTDNLFYLITAAMDTEAINSYTQLQYDSDVLTATFTYVVEYVTSNGYHYTVEKTASCIEKLQCTIQTQWFTGVALAKNISFSAYNPDAEEPMTTLPNVFNTLADSIYCVNPHSIATIPSTSYDYALVTYTSPPPRVIEDDSYINTESNVYIYDKYEGVKSVGKVKYSEDKYYVVPVNKNQVICSPEGLMVSMITFIQLI